MISRLRAGVLPSFGGGRSWQREVLAGITVAALAIPAQLATATLAGMPAVTGLYTFLAAALAAILLAGCGPLVLGAEGAIAPIIAAGLATAGALGVGDHVQLATTAALVTGVLLMLVVALRATWLADLLSRSVVVGLMAGLAVVVVISQIPAALGLHIQATTTPTKVLEIAHELDTINPMAVALFLVGMIMLRIGLRLGPKVPITLLVIVIGGLCTAVLGLRDAGLPTVGEVPPGLPGLSLPSLNGLKEVLPTALAVTLLALAQTVAVSRQSAERTDRPETSEADIRALAGANLAASFVGGFPASASVTGTKAAEDAGARTQMGSAVAAVVVGLTLTLAGQLLAYLPLATLAAVLVTVAIKLVDVDEIKRIGRFSRRTLAVTLGTAAAVVFLGVELGVLVAVIYTIADRVQLTARPLVTEMGRVPGPDRMWRSLAEEPDARPEPGVVVLRLGGPLWFGNAHWFVGDVKAAAQSLGVPAPNEAEAAGRPGTDGVPPDASGREGGGQPGAPPSAGVELGDGTAGAPRRAVVLDFSGVTDVDYTGATALQQLAHWCRERGVRLAVATTIGWSARAFARADLERELGGAVFERIDHAVESICEAAED